MFRGQFDHTIDQKGRLSVPSGFRMELQERSENPPILTRSKNYLELYPAEVWEQIERDLATKSDLLPEVQQLLRVRIGSAVPCPIDSQGRILIPKNLREHAHLENKVTLAGVLEKIEIWDTDLHAASVNETLANYSEIQQSVARGSRN